MLHDSNRLVLSQFLSYSISDFLKPFKKNFGTRSIFAYFHAYLRLSYKKWVEDCHAAELESLEIRSFLMSVLGYYQFKTKKISLYQNFKSTNLC